MWKLLLVEVKCWPAASEWLMAEIQGGLRQKGWPRPTLLTRFFPATLIWLFQRKHVAGFSEQKNARRKKKGQVLKSFIFPSRKKHPRSSSGKREKRSWMKFSAELTAR